MTRQMVLNNVFDELSEIAGVQDIQSLAYDYFNLERFSWGIPYCDVNSVADAILSSAEYGEMAYRIARSQYGAETLDEVRDVLINTMPMLDMLYADNVARRIGAMFQAACSDGDLWVSRWMLKGLVERQAQLCEQDEAMWGAGYPYLWRRIVNRIRNGQEITDISPEMVEQLKAIAFEEEA